MLINKKILMVFEIIIVIILLQDYTFCQKIQLSADMKEYAEKIRTILNNPKYTYTKKKKKILSEAKKQDNKDMEALAYIYCINISEQEGNIDEALRFNDILQNINTKNEAVIKAQKMFYGMRLRFKDTERRLTIMVKNITSKDSDFEKAINILRVWDQLLKFDADILFKCLKSIENLRIKGKTSFVIFSQIGNNERIRLSHKFFDIFASLNNKEYIEAYCNSFKNINKITASKSFLPEIETKIWNIESVTQKTKFKAILQFEIGLSLRNVFYPPFLSIEDEKDYKKQIIRMEKSYGIIEKAITFVAKSKNVFVRKSKKYTGLELALRMKAKLPLLKKYPPLQGQPINMMSFLMQSASNVMLSGLSNHIPQYRYEVIVKNGKKQYLFEWVIQNMLLSKKDLELIKNSDYGFLLPK